MKLKLTKSSILTKYQIYHFLAKKGEIRGSWNFLKRLNRYVFKRSGGITHMQVIIRLDGRAQRNLALKELKDNTNRDWRTKCI